MDIEFDDSKDRRNVRERGISLGRFAEMDLATTLVSEDARTDYGERRLRLIGQIDGRLHVAVITYRDERTRVISLRRANQREQRTYAKATVTT